MKELSVRECLHFGWNTFKSRSWFFIGCTLVLFTLSLLADIPRTIGEHAPGDSVFVLGFVGFLISTALTFLVSMGKTAFFLKAHDAPEAVKLSAMWHPRPFWKYAGAYVLVGCATVIGLVLLIVPGIIIGITFGFSLYLVIEKDLRPIAAMRESAALTKGNRWNLFLLGLALLGINILGFCALFVGLLVTVPLSILAVVHAYRVLSATTPAIVESEAALK